MTFHDIKPGNGIFAPPEPMTDVPIGLPILNRLRRPLSLLLYESKLLLNTFLSALLFETTRTAVLLLAASLLTGNGLRK